jgi:hypothetical protein
MESNKGDQHQSVMTKNTFIGFVLMLAGAAGLGFTEWWITLIWIALIAGIMGLNIIESMLAGGLALLIVWTGMAIYMDMQDKAGIISKTGILFGGLSEVMMIVVTGVIALISGLLSGWSGSAAGTFVRQITMNRRN